MSTYAQRHIVRCIFLQNLCRSYGTRPFKKIYQWGPDIPVEEMPSLQEVLARDHPKETEINIGLPPLHKTSSTRLERVKELREKRTTHLENAARNRMLKIPLLEVDESWRDYPGPVQIQTAAHFYGIYKDLFGGGAFFTPRVPLRITYEYDSQHVSPVHRGNLIKPAEASSAPRVTFESDADSLWTLLVTNPDGHLLQENVECVHWLVGNIRGNQVKEGEELFRYLQPFPPRGMGYQRMVFILFKQEEKIDYSWISGKEKDGYSVPERAFTTDTFYKKLEDVLTPAGLAFFQTDWDSSLKQFFHKKLRMKEPVYEYDWPPPLRAEEKWFPKRKPFNEYLDRYRDPKDIAAEVLKKRLKDLHPFKKDETPFPYPMALHRPFAHKHYVPEWLQLEQESEYLRRGKYRED